MLLVFQDILLTLIVLPYSFWIDWRYTLKRARLQGRYESVFSESLHLLKERSGFSFQKDSSRKLFSLCTKATGAHTQQTQSRHTFCTKYFEARRCLPDRALRGQDQPALTAAAWNPLQQGGQGYTIPVEQQYGLDTHVDTAQLWIQADLKINLEEADLWLLPQCCLCVHLCCRFKVSLPATGPLIQQVAHLYQGWRDTKGLCCECFSHTSTEILSAQRHLFTIRVRILTLDGKVVVFPHALWCKVRIQET